MIVSIPDLCPFSYTTTNFPRLLDHASYIRSAHNALLTQKNVSCIFVFANIFAHKRASLVNNICYFSCD